MHRSFMFVFVLSVSGCAISPVNSAQQQHEVMMGIRPPPVQAYDNHQRTVIFGHRFSMDRQDDPLAQACAQSWNHRYPACEKYRK